MTKISFNLCCLLKLVLCFRILHTGECVTREIRLQVTVDETAKL